jgi:prolycopene isomerase
MAAAVAGKKADAQWRFVGSHNRMKGKDSSSPTDCDVIVIGAGIAGLTASAILSRAGLRVLALEEQDRPGGYFQGFSRRGFTFDSSIQWLNNCNEGGFISDVFRFIGEDYPRCPRMRRIRRYKGESFDYLLTSDPDLFRDRLLHDFPGEGKGIRRFFADCKKNGARFDVLRHRMRAVETMPFGQRLVFGMRMLRWVLPVWKYLRVSAEKGLKRYFRSEAIQALFCCEEKFMSVMMPFCWAYAGDFQSPPPGGVEAFVRWLHACIETPSSRLLLRSRVERVLVEGRRAAGVVLADGREFRSRCIIAACDSENLFERMLPAGTVPQKRLQRLREADIYPSSVTVFLGLDCDASAIGIGEELINLTIDAQPRADHSSGDPRKGSLTVQAPSVRDGTLAPAGKSTLTIHCSARFEHEDFWRTGENFARGPAYRDLKRRFADILIDRVEKALAVDLRRHIEVLEIATPITYWRYTRNRRGSIMGASPSDRNIKNKLAGLRTPLQNLFLGGHWAVYGGGMPMAVQAAANASLLVLQQLKNPAFARLCAIMDGRA